MSNDRNHSEQFERYLKGQMDPKEAHSFEREVLDDPFAQEALEGFEAQGSNSLEDIKILKEKVSPKKKKTFSFMKVAAAIALLIVGFFSIYQFTNEIEGEQLAIEEEPIEELIQSSPEPDTISVPTAKEIESIGESTLTEEIDPKKFRQDGLKVEDKDDEVAQLAIEEENKEELLVEEIEVAEIPESEIVDIDKLVSEDDQDIAKALNSQVAGVKINQDRAALFIDTTQLEEVVITAQPLVAKKEALGNSITDSDEEIKIAKRAKASIPLATARSKSTENISGKVTDDTGEALPGVNVIIKGTTTGVVTDLDGNYQIPKINRQTLVFAYVGFESQEIDVGSRSTIDVTMGGATELQEVVVTGYSDNEETSPSYSPAQPANGNRAFKKYLEENLQYPQAATANNIEGTVVLELTIDSNGKVSNISIKKSLGYGCDEEAIRLVREGPKWDAAEKDGNKVEDKLRVRVKFKLDR
ncbi:energy transducer TonB [Ekhidna sp.]